MALKLYSDTDIQNIANAIRQKNSALSTYKVSEMASAISNINLGWFPSVILRSNDFNSTSSGTLTNGTKTYNGVVEQATSRLPNEYQEVEYISSSGSQYIDTGVVADGTTGWELTASWTCRVGTKSALVGNFIWGGSNAGSLYYQDSGSNIFFQYSGGGSSQIEYVCATITSVAEKTKYSFNAEETNKFKINDVTLLSNIWGYITDSTYYLFASHRKNVTTPFCYSTCTMYSSKFYKNNVMVRNLIPCYRKSDEVIGMYDLVNDVFYTNNGSGTFTKGPNIYNKSVKFEKITDLGTYTYSVTNGTASATGTVNIVQPIEYSVDVTLT